MNSKRKCTLGGAFLFRTHGAPLMVGGVISCIIIRAMFVYCARKSSSLASHEQHQGSKEEDVSIMHLSKHASDNYLSKKTGFYVSIFMTISRFFKGLFVTKEIRPQLQQPLPSYVRARAFRNMWVDQVALASKQPSKTVPVAVETDVSGFTLGI